MAARLIAATGERFVDFGPFAPAISDGGRVAFTATRAKGGAAVFVGEVDGVVCEVKTGALPAAPLSHPALDDGGLVCFYADVEGQRCLVVAAGGRGEIIDGSLDRRVGPLGPTLAAGLIAYRLEVAGVATIALADAATGAITEIASVGDELASFEGLPLVTESGSVIFRARHRSGADLIAIGDGRGTKAVVETGDRFTALGRFPARGRASDIVFAATEVGGGEGIFRFRGGLECLVDERAGFESFRGALLGEGDDLVFFATPIGGQLGVYRLEGGRADRIIGIGDSIDGGEVADLALNPVSINASGHLAIRLRLASGEARIIGASC